MHIAVRIIIYLVHFVSQLFVILSFYKAYTKTKSTANLLFSLSFLSFLGGYIISYIPHSLPKEEHFYNITILLFVGTNALLWLGILIFTYAFIYIINDKITLIGHVPAIIAGFIIATICDPSKISLTVDETFDVWVPKYSFTHIYFYIALFIILVIAIFQVYYLKLMQVKKQHKLDMSFLGIVLFLFWLISVFFDPMRVIRFAVLPIAIFLFGISVNRNPLVFLITKSKLNKLYLFTSFHLPFYSYDFIKQEISHKLSSVEILNATKTAYSESLNLSENEVDIIKTLTQDIVTIQHNKLKVLMIGKNIDGNIKSAIILALNSLKPITESQELLINPVLSDKKEKLITKVFIVYLSEIFPAL